MPFPSFLATCIAANSAAPDDIPINTPSFLANSTAVFIASWSETAIISSTYSPLYIEGINPAPIPWILCAPGPLPARTCDFSGSTATTFSFFIFSFNFLETPVIVPPVPTPATKASKSLIAI